MKLSEKKKSVAGKMKGLWEKHPDRSPESRVQAFGEQHPSFRSKGMKKYRSDKGRASLSPVKHKVDVAGQESYKEEDK